MNRPLTPAALDEVDRAIINALQGEFPLCERPYARAAETLGLTEESLLARLKNLFDRGVLTRFGPMYQVERIGGAFCLAALAVPEPDYERIAALVNALPQVAHNYRREHVLNMWFVLATETPEGIAESVARIEAETGLMVHAFPKEREFFVEMRLRA